MSEFDAQCGRCNTKYRFRHTVENKGTTSECVREDVSCPVCKTQQFSEANSSTKILLKDSKAWDLT